MRKLFLLLMVVSFLINLNQSLVAQEEKTVANKLFYIELGGPGIIMSANFDSRFKSNERLGLGVRVGIGYGVEKYENILIEFMKDVFLQDIDIDRFGGYFDNVTRTFYSVPVGLNYILGNPEKASTFEVGAGVTFLTRKVSLYNYEMEKPGHAVGHVTFMYRIAPVNGGFSFRIGFTPIIGTAGDLFPMGTVGFGYAF